MVRERDVIRSMYVDCCPNFQGLIHKTTEHYFKEFSLLNFRFSNEIMEH